MTKRNTNLVRDYNPDTDRIIEPDPLSTSSDDPALCGYCGRSEINVGPVFTSDVHGQLCRYCSNKLVDFRLLAKSNAQTCRSAIEGGLAEIAGALARTATHWAKIGFAFDGAKETCGHCRFALERGDHV